MNVNEEARGFLEEHSSCRVPILKKAGASNNDVLCLACVPVQLFPCSPLPVVGGLQTNWQEYFFLRSPSPFLP